MNAWIWLLAAVVAGAAAYYTGWRAWDGYRRRDVLDANTDRYLAWRGRAAPPSGRPSEGMTGEERRNVYIGIGLGIVAVVCVFVFLSYPPG
ncbi:MAG TPA: hypothetical protein VFN14_02540 [Candidatus Limnocylindria bacterium]|nr:hypothetical protein [Candidatus Limnocylindria bacterium]